MTQDFDVAQFWTWVRYYRDNGQRMGQAFMNALHSVSPEKYAEVSGTQYDVFYTTEPQDLYRFRGYLGI